MTSEQRAAENQRRFNFNRAIIEEAKDTPCMDCGVSYPKCVMDLDHRPGEIKSFSISKGLRKSTGVLRAEIAKCDAVCSNCHRIRTHERGQYVPPYLAELRIAGFAGSGLGRDKLKVEDQICR